MMARHSNASRLVRVAIILPLLGLFAFQALASEPDVIEAGASQNHFYIEPSYDGTSIALFGSVDPGRLNDQPFDVVVTIRGPIKPVTVWKKNRRLGLWVNTQSLTFEGRPITTRPSRQNRSPGLLRQRNARPMRSASMF